MIFCANLSLAHAHNAAIDDRDFKHLSFEQKMKLPNFYVPVSSKKLDTYHHASTLVISCVDFRLQDETEYLLNNVLGLLDDYDNISLPGSALAMVNDKSFSWGKGIEDIILLLHKLHDIKRIILLDHRDCGAYKLALGHEHTKDPYTELEAHKKIMLQAKKIIQRKLPNIEVYCLLIGLDGVVENFSTQEENK
jgi:hypothetical protein